ncbi:MAG: response regulator [Pirellulales bacterium]|nr:response regulator [Pirellulales bacterium]
MTDDAQPPAIPLDALRSGGVRPPRAAHPAPHARSTAPAAGGRDLRVLVVSRERRPADPLAAYVSSLGHIAREAFDAHSALRIAAGLHPHVVFVGCDLPHMDGRLVTRQLRLDFPRSACLVIGMLAWSTERRRQQCLDAGVDMVLVKPVLREVVDVLLTLEYHRVNRSHKNRSSGRVSGPEALDPATDEATRRQFPEEQSEESRS